jgi:hypothetical protein
VRVINSIPLYAIFDDELRYMGGGTMTHKALDQMRTLLFTKNGGARNQLDGHPRVCVMVTDGKSNV